MAKEKDKSKPKVVKMTDAEEKKKALESAVSYTHLTLPTILLV